MKTAAKVFVILDIIRSVLIIIFKDELGFNSEFLLFYNIIAIIIDADARYKLDNSTKKSDLTAIGILSLFFCNLLGGIFILCVSDKDLSENLLNAEIENQNNVNSIKIKNPIDISANADTHLEELNKLKFLYDNGFITEDEYKEKREKYIDLL